MTFDFLAGTLLIIHMFFFYRIALVYNILYTQVPSDETWKNNRWTRRKIGEVHRSIEFDHCLARVYTVHPSHQECLYLRFYYMR